LQLNIDGAQSFKMSKFGFWPFMGIINEAKYKLRRSFVVLISLWYGNKKPPANGFLDHGLNELNKIQNTGFTVKNEKFKLRVLIVTSDTVARPIMRCSRQYNGKYGCDFCLHPGKLVQKS